MKFKKITFIAIILFALFFLFSKETLAGCTSETTKEYNAYTNNLFWAILPLFVLVLFFINNIFMLMVARHYRVSLEKKKLFVYLATVVLVSTFSFSLFFVPLFFVGYHLNQIGTIIEPSSLFPFPLSSILITFTPAQMLGNRLSAGIIPRFDQQLFILINPPVLFTLMVTCITSFVLLKKMFRAEKHLIKIAVLNSLLLHPLFITTILQVLALLSFSLFPFQGTKYTGNCF